MKEKPEKAGIKQGAGSCPAWGHLGIGNINPTVPIILWIGTKTQIDCLDLWAPCTISVIRAKPTKAEVFSIVFEMRKRDAQEILPVGCISPFGKFNAI